VGRKFVLGLDLGSKLAVNKVYLEGEIDAQTFKLDTTLGARTVGVQKLIEKYASAEER
jgi:hypothetical protein